MVRRVDVAEAEIVCLGKVSGKFLALEAFGGREARLVMAGHVFGKDGPDDREVPVESALSASSCGEATASPAAARIRQPNANRPRMAYFFAASLISIGTKRSGSDARFMILSEYSSL